MRSMLSMMFVFFPLLMFLNCNKTGTELKCRLLLISIKGACQSFHLFEDLFEGRPPLRVFTPALFDNLYHFQRRLIHRQLRSAQRRRLSDLADNLCQDTKKQHRTRLEEKEERGISSSSCPFLFRSVLVCVTLCNSSDSQSVCSSVNPKDPRSADTFRLAKIVITPPITHLPPEQNRKKHISGTFVFSFGLFVHFVLSSGH